jgi:tocopherol O-methyltransferase
MARTNEKPKIVEHYDLVSPYYQSLWGEHIHHGYWIRGDESKETAQIQLIEHLARLANLQPDSRLLDIGCGFGGTSIYLAKQYAISATGITISPVQVEMANREAKRRSVSAKFLLMDAEAMNFPEPFDLLWSVESISHYQDIPGFFSSSAKFLKPGGNFALTDWFRKENPTPAERKKYIDPIDRGMFVELRGMNDYENFLTASGFRVVHREDITAKCAKSWDIGVDIIKDKSFWAMAAKLGPHFVTNLKAFQAIRAAIASGNFVYGLFVAKKPESNGNSV